MDVLTAAACRVPGRFWKLWHTKFGEGGLVAQKSIVRRRSWMGAPFLLTSGTSSSSCQTHQTQRRVKFTATGRLSEPELPARLGGSATAHSPNWQRPHFAQSYLPRHTDTTIRVGIASTHSALLRQSRVNCDHENDTTEAVALSLSKPGAAYRSDECHTRRARAYAYAHACGGARCAAPSAPAAAAALSQNAVKM